MRDFSRNVWLLLGLMILSVNLLAVDDKDSVQYYIENYGVLDKEHEHFRRIHQVFDKVSQVADKSSNRPPQLTLIQSFGEPNDPLALALPDGHIVLSERAIDIIYKDVSLGDTRTAFVLGHELAHLAKDDFLHREFFSPNDLPYRDSDRQRKELEADVRGFIYAAMAGYPVDKLLGSQQQNFFVYWQQQSFQELGGDYPSAEERAKLLRARLQKLLENLSYFHFGVRLSHFQRCDDAVYFFREFLKYFPGREVYNNLGVCELQRARKALGKDAYLYWFPSVLDVTTQIEKFSLPYASKGERKALADESLKKAKTYFKLASQMDPSYVPAKVNLAITMLYLEKIYKARAAIEDAHRLVPDDLDIQGMRAVIMHEEGKQSHIDMWPNVIQSLEELKQESNIPPSVLYNMAQLLEQRGRTGADEFWEQLGQRLAELPAPIRHIVCEKTSCPPLQGLGSPKAVFHLPVKLGAKTKHDKTLRKWRKSEEVKLYKIYERFYREPEGAVEVLALKRRVEMVVLKKPGNVRKEDLPNYCGRALRERRVVNGSLWSCQNWAALVVDDEVAEVWVIKGFER